MSINVATGTLVSREEAAELLGVSERTVDRLRLRGRLRAVQLVPRGRVRFRTDDVEALLTPELRGAAPAREDELAWK
jgi:excisionase family DNA binding protein